MTANYYSTEPNRLLGHVSLAVPSLEVSKPLYTAALAALGLSITVEFPGVVYYGYSNPKTVWFGLTEVPTASTAPKEGTHIGLNAPSKEAVDAFYEAAIANGAKDNGPPGIRAQYGKGYYAAFVIDKDGHRLEVSHNDLNA